MSTEEIGGHVDTKEPEGSGRGRRRRHTDEFKSSVVAQCTVPGVSIAAVALQNGLNANLLRRWVNEAGVEDEEHAGTAQVAASESAAEVALEVTGFVPVKLATSEATKGTIVIEVRRGSVQVKVSWPLAAMTECGAWLRELMK